MKKWSEVLRVVSGKNQKEVENPDGQYPIYGSGGIIGRADDYLCEAGATVIGRKGSINKPIFVNERFWNIDTAFGLQPGTSLLPKYLFYFCKSFHFQALDKSTTIPSLAKRDLLNIEMPAPPLDVQERVVSRLDELFSKLDNVAGLLEDAQRRLSLYRQAFLRDTFADIADSAPLDDVAVMVDPHPSHRTPPKCQNGAPYIGIGDIDYSVNQIHFDTARKVSYDALKDHQSRYTIHEGDFIIGKIGTIGKPFRLPLPHRYALSANVILIQPKRDVIHPGYLYWQFVSPYIAQQLSEGARATTQAAFGITKARLLKIRICDANTQQRLARQIEEHMSVCDSVERTISAALRQSETMRLCILKRAFTEPR